MSCLCPKNAVQHSMHHTTARVPVSTSLDALMFSSLSEGMVPAQISCMSSLQHGLPWVLHIFVNYKSLFAAQQYAVNQPRSQLGAHQPAFLVWQPASLPTQLSSPGLRNHRTPQAPYRVREEELNWLGFSEGKRHGSERWQCSNSFNL